METRQFAPEPFKIKMIEKIGNLNKEERKKAIKQAGQVESVRGKMILQSFGKQIFSLYGKDFFSDMVRSFFFAVS